MIQRKDSLCYIEYLRGKYDIYNIPYIQILIDKCSTEEKERIIVLYTYESDLGDGWEDPCVHQYAWPLREAALKMGVNIIYYSLTQ